ncbi:MAG: glucosamine-6-phosphate deaminase [Alphaproteobacteria bacterium]|nr:glucosamine-6-phosphate deaminase [Alphaproteobacteria bacterium]
MRLIIKDNYDNASLWVAKYIAKKINDFAPTHDKPFVLGLPTGSTPLGVYKELIKMYKNGEVSFSNVVTFNMDEYVGLSSEHPQSYHYFMWDNFFNHIDIKKENTHILNGLAENIEEECENYEKAIKEIGGIHLFLGGIGEDGHIAFNEPFSSLSSRTRQKTLTTDTIKVNSRFFDNDISQVPTTALTVGVATIMDAKEVIIMATGAKKAHAVYMGVEQPISHKWTISALQAHRHGIIVCDEPATAELETETVKYFKDIEK